LVKRPAEKAFGHRGLVLHPRESCTSSPEPPAESPFTVVSHLPQPVPRGEAGPPSVITSAAQYQPPAISVAEVGQPTTRSSSTNPVDGVSIQTVK
jgi:hypothetical protein